MRPADRASAAVFLACRDLAEAPHRLPAALDAVESAARELVDHESLVHRCAGWQLGILSRQARHAVDDNRALVVAHHVLEMRSHVQALRAAEHTSLVEGSKS